MPAKRLWDASRCFARIYEKVAQMDVNYYLANYCAEQFH